LKFTTCRILKDGIDENGYCVIGFQKDGKRYCPKVHRLVVNVFIDNVDNKQFVDHINNEQYHFIYVLL
jgi:hypothetical protein